MECSRCEYREATLLVSWKGLPVFEMNLCETCFSKLSNKWVVISESDAVCI